MTNACFIGCGQLPFWCVVFQHAHGIKMTNACFIGCGQVPFWARDQSEEGIDRSMDLPCFGKKLKGDYDPPFTCGSDTRRAIIKYFVRDEINRNGTGNTITESLVQKRIAMLKEAWKDVKRYGDALALDIVCAQARANHAPNLKKQVRVPVQDPFVHRSARVQQPSVLHVV
jgi:hypothetical protein